MKQRELKQLKTHQFLKHDSREWIFTTTRGNTLLSKSDHLPKVRDKTKQHSGDSWMYPYQRTPMRNPYMSYGRNYLFEGNAITKCRGSPIGFAGFEYGLWGIGFGGSPIGYEGSLSRFKVQGNFLLLCSSTNFVGYSYKPYIVGIYGL